MQEIQETWVPSIGQETPLEEEVETHSLQYSSLGNPIDGGRILMGYSPWGCKEWDTTICLSMHTHAHCSCYYWIYILSLSHLIHFNSWGGFRKKDGSVFEGQGGF